MFKPAEGWPGSRAYISSLEFQNPKVQPTVLDARPDERGQEKLRNGNALLLRTPPTTTAMLNEWFAMRLVIARHLRDAFRGARLDVVVLMD